MKCLTGWAELIARSQEPEPANEPKKKDDKDEEDDDGGDSPTKSQPEKEQAVLV